jgi:hypothetical protein
MAVHTSVGNVGGRFGPEVIRGDWLKSSGSPGPLDDRGEVALKPGGDEPVSAAEPRLRVRERRFPDRVAADRSARRNSNRRLLRSLFTREREMPENAKLFYRRFPPT